MEVKSTQREKFEKGTVWWPGRYMPWTAGGWRHALRAGTCGVRMSHGGHNNLAGSLNEARFALDAQPHMKLDYTPFSAPRAPPWPTAFPAHDEHATCRASGVWSLTHGHNFFKATAPPHAAAPATGHVEYCGLSVVRRPQKPPRFSAMCWLRTPQTRRDEPGDVHEQHWSHRGPHATPRPSVASPTPHRQPSRVPAAAAKSRPIGRSEARTSTRTTAA